MTHMHIPDGVLPVWLWMLGFIIMTCAVGFCVFRLRAIDLRKEVPLLGAVSAVMLVAMSLEILPIAYHINLTVVAGILLGPALGFLAAFITSLMLALMGHGGITVIGINTLLLGSETILGHALFYVFKKRPSVFFRAAGATVLTLFTVTFIMIGIVAVSHIDPDHFFHGHEHGHEETAAHDGEVSLVRFAVIVLSLGVVGWIIEAFITGVVVRFLSQVKPELLSHVLHRNDTENDKRSSP